MTEPTQEPVKTVTAVKQGGTIQVGYTPIAATLQGELLANADPSGTESADDGITPGFKLAALPKGGVSLTDDVRGEGSVDSGMIGDGDKSQGKVAQGGEEVLAQADRNPSILTLPKARDIADTHPAVIIALLVLFSLFTHMITWQTTPLIDGLWLLDKPYFHLGLAVVHGFLLLWLAHSMQKRGATPVAMVVAVIVMVIGLMAEFAWLQVGITQDTDLYELYGSTVLATGELPLNPSPEYPPLAVWTFTLMAYLSDLLQLHLALVNAALMAIATIPIILYFGRSKHSWMVVGVTVIPTSVVWIATRFDILPTMLMVLAIGLLAPWHETRSWRVIVAAFILGLAAALKWYPGLVAITFFFGYLRLAKWSYCAYLGIFSFIGFSIPHFPWILTENGREALLAAYTFHAERNVTGESFIWLILHPLGIVGKPEMSWIDYEHMDAGVIPTIILAIAILIPFIIAFFKPHNMWVMAVISPIFFLLGNRIFSVQFVITIFFMWALLAAILPKMNLALKIFVAFTIPTVSSLNWLIWPAAVASWDQLSGIMFGLIVAVTAWLAIIAGREEKEFRLTTRIKNNLEKTGKTTNKVEINP